MMMRLFFAREGLRGRKIVMGSPVIIVCATMPCAAKQISADAVSRSGSIGKVQSSGAKALYFATP